MQHESRLTTGWETRVTRLSHGAIERHAVLRDGRAVSYATVLTLWQDDETFRAFFVATLAAAPFTAFRWETPPLTTALADRAFEFVLLDSPSLERPVDPHAFADQFDAAADDEVLVFTNLGGDAVMVVPSPQGPQPAYAHVGAFVRYGPEAQIATLWRVVGRVMQQRLGERPVWLSTAGMGVVWVHVRVDSRPKYYAYRPFASAAPSPAHP